MDYLNLTRLFKAETKHYLRHMMVDRGTMSVTNGHVLIRKQTSIPDGLYKINISDLTRIEDMDSVFEYPNLEKLKPAWFNELDSAGRILMQPTCKLPAAMLKELLVFCTGQQYKDCEDVRFTTYALLVGDGVFRYPFNVPHSFLVNKLYLEIVLTSLSGLGDLVLVQQPIERSPVFIGANWGTCALIMPLGAG